MGWSLIGTYILVPVWPEGSQRDMCCRSIDMEKAWPMAVVYMHAGKQQAYRSLQSSVTRAQGWVASNPNPNPDSQQIKPSWETPYTDNVEWAGSTTESQLDDHNYGEAIFFHQCTQCRFPDHEKKDCLLENTRTLAGNDKEDVILATLSSKPLTFWDSNQLLTYQTLKLTYVNS